MAFNLAANIFRPKGEGPFPVILMRTPYGKLDDKFGEAKRYTTAGYAMVVQDCRGRGKSDGVWDPFRYDVQDGYDTQEWIGHQPWCNGSIGTAGGSYVGWTQWAPAPKASRYLKAMVAHRALRQLLRPRLQRRRVSARPPDGLGHSASAASRSPRKRLQEAFRHLPLRTFAEQFDKKVPYLDDWVTHYTYDDYWKARGIDYHYADVTVPILNIGGWYDIFSKVTLDLVTQVRAASTNREVRRNRVRRDRPLDSWRRREEGWRARLRRRCGPQSRRPAIQMVPVLAQRPRDRRPGLARVLPVRHGREPLARRE